MTHGKKSGIQLDREIDEVLEARKRREAKTGTSARSSGVPSQGEYERRELAEAQRAIDDVRRAPLADRKAAAQAFFEAMRDTPDVVAERVGWLLGGNYGYGSMLIAKRALGAPRSNRAAALTQVTGALEWQSPADMTRAMWKKLTPGQQAALDRAVQRVIRSAEEEE